LPFNWFLRDRSAENRLGTLGFRDFPDTREKAGVRMPQSRRSRGCRAEAEPSVRQNGHDGEPLVGNAAGALLQLMPLARSAGKGEFALTTIR
jgi:hypothetical protein